MKTSRQGNILSCIYIIKVYRKKRSRTLLDRDVALLTLTLKYNVAGLITIPKCLKKLIIGYFQKVSQYEIFQTYQLVCQDSGVKVI
jgi:hypothetical protein